MEENYLKLLKYEKELEAKGKSFWAENEKEYINFLKYEISILDHLKWERKHQYVLLITNFLDKKIDIDEYESQLFKLEHEIQSLLEKLKLDFEMLREFKPNSVSKGLCNLIENLFSDLKVIELDDDLRDNYEISEEELRNGAKEILLQIQQYP